MRRFVIFYCGIIAFSFVANSFRSPGTILHGHNRPHAQLRVSLVPLQMDMSDGYYSTGYVDLPRSPPRSHSTTSTPDEHQLDAIISQDPAILIIAGPGSGKTRVMAARLAHLLHSGECQQSEVLLISFTGDAAQNLLMKAQDKLNEINSPVGTIREVDCFTFHSFCNSVLKKHSNLVFDGRKEFVLANEGDQVDIMNGLMEQKSMSPNLAVVKNLLTKIRYWKELGLGYLGVRKKSLVDWTDERAYDLYPEYQRLTKQQSTLVDNYLPLDDNYVCIEATATNEYIAINVTYPIQSLFDE